MGNHVSSRCCNTSTRQKPSVVKGNPIVENSTVAPLSHSDKDGGSDDGSDIKEGVRGSGRDPPKNPTSPDEDDDQRFDWIVLNCYRPAYSSSEAILLAQSGFSATSSIEGNTSMFYWRKRRDEQ